MNRNATMIRDIESEKTDSPDISHWYDDAPIEWHAGFMHLAELRPITEWFDQFELCEVIDGLNSYSMERA